MTPTEILHAQRRLAEVARVHLEGDEPDVASAAWELAGTLVGSLSDGHEDPAVTINEAIGLRLVKARLGPPEPPPFAPPNPRWLANDLLDTWRAIRSTR